MTGLLLDAATIIGALAVIVTALGALFRWTPLRWVARTLIGAPLASWFRKEVTEVVQPIADDVAGIKAELQFNGGHTIKDQVQYLTNREKARQAG